MDEISKPALDSTADLQKIVEAETVLRAHPLRIGISTRALFDLEEEHQFFKDQGIQAYARMQLEREDEIIGKGTAFEVISRMLSPNVSNALPYVEVILLS